MFIVLKMAIMRHQNKYSLTARLLHWASALVIMWATLSGFMITLPGTSEHTKELIAHFNVALTALFIPFFCWRVIHRMLKGAPVYNVLSNKEALLAKVVHIILYLLVGVVLFSGLLMMDQDIVVFNVFKLDPLVQNASWINMFKSLHEFTTRLLAAGIVLHLLALVKHEIVGHKILTRMV